MLAPYESAGNEESAKWHHVSLLEGVATSGICIGLFQNILEVPNIREAHAQTSVDHQ